MPHAPVPPAVRALNGFLDALPRRRVWRRDHASPAFLTCGVAGFHAAILLTFAAGLCVGIRPLALAAAAAAAGVSFFPYVLLWRWLGRGERMIQSDQVWLGLAAAGIGGWAAGAPPLRLLDAAAPGFALFLAFGRVGCLLSGCCHGRPASLGIVYPADRELPSGRTPTGVRLFPVQGVEAVGQLGIAAAGLVVLAAGPAGAGLVWFLAAHALLRFGMEGLRGDRRASWLGLSRTRWICLAQLAAAFAAGEAAWGGGIDARDAGVLAALVAVLAAALVARWLLDPAPLLLDSRHLAELRGVVRMLAGAAAGGPTSALGAPAARATSRGVSVAAGPAPGGGLHLSLALPDDVRDVPLLCAVAARVVPGADPAAAALSRGRILHLRVGEEGAGAPGGEADPDDERVEAEARALHLAVVRALQAEEESEVGADAGGGRIAPLPPAARGEEAYFAGPALP